MQRLVYKTIDGSYSDEVFCLSHMFDWDYFEDDCRMENLNVNRHNLIGVTTELIKPRTDQLFLDYANVVTSYLGGYLEFHEKDFSFSFSPLEPKLFILFMSNWIRVVHEEDDWFMQTFVNAEGGLFRRLWTVYETHNSSYEFRNWLHQTCSPIKDMNYEDMDIFDDNLWEWIFFLRSGPALINSSDSPSYEDTMEAYLFNFLNIKHLNKQEAL